MIIYVQAVGHDNIEVALFWGIRLTILSLGINPFLYGLLSGPYRQSYGYILRLVFSRCCKRIDPPNRTGYGETSARHVLLLIHVYHYSTDSVDFQAELTAKLGSVNFVWKQTYPK